MWKLAVRQTWKRMRTASFTGKLSPIWQSLFRKVCFYSGWYAKLDLCFAVGKSYAFAKMLDIRILFWER